VYSRTASRLSAAYPMVGRLRGARLAGFCLHDEGRLLIMWSVSWRRAGILAIRARS
jgi:hypothetical protein